jgi:hypothetical protein
VRLICLLGLTQPELIEAVGDLCEEGPEVDAVAGALSFAARAELKA